LRFVEIGKAQSSTSQRDAQAIFVEPIRQMDASVTQASLPVRWAGSVPVSPATRAGAERFRLKSARRTSGYSPVGIVFDRTPATPKELRFATWKVSADWMKKGTFIEMMTPKEMPKAISLSVSSHAQNSEKQNEESTRDPVKGEMFRHPHGARRLTSVPVTAPGAASLPPAASYIAEHGCSSASATNGLLTSRWMTVNEA